MPAGAVETAMCPAAAPDFDHHDPAAMADPYPIYAELRRRCPVARSERHGGFFVAVSRRSAAQVLSEFRAFTSTEGVALPAMGTTMFPVDLDPPLQTKFRKVLNRYFTVDEAEHRRPVFQAVVDRLLDDVIESGRADVANDLTRPAIGAIMLPIIGIPEPDRVEFTTAVDFMSNARTTDVDRLARTNRYVMEYLTALAEAAMGREAGPDDFVGFIAREPIDGRRLAADEIAKVLLVVLFGALDTTHATLNTAVLHLARCPEDKARLRAEPALWRNAIEEFVRFASPIQFLRRTATHEFDFHGATMRKGDPILAGIGAGNRDPEAFAEPDRCLLDRDAGAHLGFGAGAHVCLGRNFARVIIDVTLRTLLERIPDFEVDADFQPSFTSGEGRRMHALPISFTPGIRVSL